MMGRHPSTRELSEYVDGDLDPRQRARIAMHLGRCTPCREIIREWSTATEVLRRSPTPELPSDLFERIQLRRAAGERALLPGLAPSRRRIPALLLAVAATVALVVIGSAMFTTTSDLQASAGELRILPTEHGAEWTAAEYRAPPFLDRHDRMVLWARYRAQDGTASGTDLEPIIVAELSRADDGIFRGSFRLPEAVMYALFAVERPGASGAHSDPSWSLLVYGPDGRPLLAAPELGVNDPVGRSHVLAYSATHPSTDPSLERVHRWSQLHFRTGVDVRR